MFILKFMSIDLRGEGSAPIAPSMMSRLNCRFFWIYASCFLFFFYQSTFAQTQTQISRASTEDFKVQRITPPLIEGKPGIPNVQIYICNNITDPQGVMVICTNSAGLVILEKYTKGAEWIEFAEEHQLGLVVMTFAHDRRADKLKRGYDAATWVGDWLLQSIEHFYGPEVPLLLYGEQRGGTFVASFVNWRPERVKAWSGYTNQWFEKPNRVKEFLPGIVAYDAEDELASAEQGGEWYFQAARKLEKPLSEVRLTTPFKTRKEALATFSRHFFSSILKDDLRSSATWISLKSKDAAGLELMRNPKGVGWLPNSSLIDEFSTLTGTSTSNPETEIPPIIEHTVITNNPLQPELRMFLRLPVGMGGKQVDGVLAFCSWEGNREAILKKLYPDQFERVAVGNAGGLKDLFTQLTDFAEKNNLAMLTWETAQVWSLKPSYYSEKETEDREANFELMASAWVTGVEALARKTGMPEDGYFLFGISRGAQWAHRLALRRPERFIAVQFHVASTFDVPTPEAADLLWLVSTGENEVGYKNGDASRFYDQCRQLDYPVILKASKGLGHDENLEISRLREAFLDYAITVRNKMRAQGLHRPADILKQDIRQAPWIGDYTTNKVVPATSAEGIPARYRVPLPTPEFVAAWSGRPAPRTAR